MFIDHATGNGGIVLSEYEVADGDPEEVGACFTPKRRPVVFGLSPPVDDGRGALGNLECRAGRLMNFSERDLVAHILRTIADRPQA